MSFALAVKKELLTNQYSLQGAIELMSGLIATSITQENSELEQRDALMRNFTITIANHEITNLILEMFDEMKIKYQSHPAQRYILVFDFPYQNNLQLIKTPS